MSAPKAMNDIQAARDFIAHVLEISRDTARALKEAVAMAGIAADKFDDGDDSCFAIALLIFGFSFASLKTNSPIMSQDRAIKVADLCKSTLFSNYDIPHNDARSMIKTIDGYVRIYETSIAASQNPFFPIADPLIKRCVKDRLDKTPRDAISAVDPFLGAMVCDLLLISLSQSLLYWKHYLKAEGN